MNTTQDALHTFIVKVCQEKMNIEVPSDADLNQEIGKAYDLDSISMYELILNLEEQYGFKVADDDIAKIEGMNIEQLSQYISDICEPA